ncbi:MAG: aminotransferase class I/II-fold pyridoxal phosphate-dependent enzyme [Pseudomonadota bacterium]
MQYPERFSNLPAYAFPRLRALLDHHPAGGEVLHMTIGEPKHAFPALVTDEIAKHAAGFANYPPNEGAPELLAAIAAWVTRRYGVPVDPDRNLMALNGTREGLFNAAVALCPETKAGGRPVVLIPNPFYQVYMVATLTAAADPVYVPATAETDFLPDYSMVPEEILKRTAVVYICSPSNPQGGVASVAYWTELLTLAERYDFRIFADECYSEIYRGAPPPGVLEAVYATGADPERVLAFHSLSKRSNLPGLRSGAVTGGPKSIAAMRQLRTYAGAPLPMPLQMAAAAVWSDETHVEENRALYGEKYAAADDIFGTVDGYIPPQAGFFLWLPVADGEAASLDLWQKTGVRVLPGAYLGQGEGADNPGAGFVRVAMVAPKDDMLRGLLAVREHLY